MTDGSPVKNLEWGLPFPSAHWRKRDRQQEGTNMSEMENTSDAVARLLQEIEQHVAAINCAKVELRGQPDKLGQLITDQVQASVWCMEQLNPLVGQRKAIRLVVERYQNVVREE